MKNLHCFNLFANFHRFIYQEKLPSPEIVQAKPASPEKTEKLEPKQIVKILKDAGFQNTRFETKTEQYFKLHEHERKEPGIPRHVLPPNHPDNETVPVEVITYRFAYRGIEAYLRITQQEQGFIRFVISTEKIGKPLKAQNLNEVTAKIKEFIEEYDPNFFKELMIKEGFKEVRFREKGENRYPSYDFVADNGEKGNIVRLERSGDEFRFDLDFRGDRTIFIVRASTLAESVSKIMDLIKTRGLE